MKSHNIRRDAPSRLGQSAGSGQIGYDDKEEYFPNEEEACDMPNYQQLWHAIDSMNDIHRSLESLRRDIVGEQKHEVALAKETGPSASELCQPSLRELLRRGHEHLVKTQECCYQEIEQIRVALFH